MLSRAELNQRGFLGPVSSDLQLWPVISCLPKGKGKRISTASSRMQGLCPVRRGRKRGRTLLLVGFLFPDPPARIQ